MKVLQIGKYYPPHMGGMETHLRDLCSGLRKSMDVQVLVANDGASDTRESVDGVSVSRVASIMSLASTPLCPMIVSEIRRARTDLIHIHLPNPVAVLAYLVSGHSARLVITYHSDTVRQKVSGALFSPFLHAVLRRASAIIATSPNYVETSRVLSYHRRRCVVIPYGIRTADFRETDPAPVRGLKRQYGNRIVLTVGRLVYYKGFDNLIRAMANVEGHLLIVGDGPLRRDLEKLAGALGVSGKVTFVGEIQNGLTVPFYHAANLFVLPSVARSEAFGIVQIEAMASGTPVVNTALDSGVPFVSQNGMTGLTVPPGDPAALACAINKLIEDRELNALLGEAAQRRAEAEFDLELMVKRTIQLYNQALNGERCKHSLAASA